MCVRVACRQVYLSITCTAATHYSALPSGMIHLPYIPHYVFMQKELSPRRLWLEISRDTPHDNIRYYITEERFT